MKPVLEVRNIAVYYFTGKGVVRAVDDVSLTGYSGELIAIVGESGSGKSTLGYALLNLVPYPGKIVKGSIIIDGLDITRLNPKELRMIRGKLVSMVFQDPFTTLDPVRRVGDQLVEVFTEHGIDRKTAEERVIELLKSVGLSERIAKSYPHQLSGGQRQRVSIAAAIALKPKVLVADEPTTALDVVVQKQIMDLLDSIKKTGTTIILITHDIALAAERADKIAVMYAGKIVEIGDKREVLTNPLHPYTKALLSSVPSLARKEWPKPIPGQPPDLRNPPPGCRFHPRCPYAEERCKLEEPPMYKISEIHSVKCWLYAGERGDQ